MSNPSITADKTPWYQWDTGLTVTVSGGEMNECHFANRKQGTAYVQAVINGVARVPDELMQVAAPIKAYGYVSDGAGGQTYVEQTFEVIARNIPSDYTYTKTAQKTIRDAEAARDEAVQAAKDAKASELDADDSAVEASNSAQSAGESASAAATSESNAAKSAGDAAKSASDAKAAAGKAVEDAGDLLKTYTDNAKTSADNAATSASNAADAASAASGSASAAEQSATDASNAKAAAQTAKAEAEAAKSEAATSASNAAESATAAEKSASDAAASVSAINVISPLNVNRNRPAVSTSEFALAIGRDAKADVSDGVAIGPNAHAIASAVALGTNSVANMNGTISVGNDNTKRRIMNVASPTYQYDASNKKYTDDNDTKTLTEAKKYTDANTSNALVGNVSGKLLHVEDALPSKPVSLTIDGAYKQDGTPSPDNPVPIEVIENPVLKVTGADTPYAGTSLPITLPAEHPYLAALPDGTHDEIVVRGGRVSINCVLCREVISDVKYIGNSESFQYVQVGVATGKPIDGDRNFICDRFIPGGKYAGGVYVVGGVNAMFFFCFQLGTFQDSSEAAAWFAANPTTVVYMDANGAKTIDLGKADNIPALPETISNVWTDAELTTNMSMTYKRDINIAFENLAQAVVAAAAGE